MNNELETTPLTDITNQMDLLQELAYRLPEYYDMFNWYYEQLRKEIVRRFPPLENDDALKLARVKENKYE